MSTTVILDSKNPEQLELLLKVAREMGIHVSLLNDTFEEMSEEDENKLWQKISLKSMEKEWLHPDNDHWDEFFKNAKKIR